MKEILRIRQRHQRAYQAGADVGSHHYLPVPDRGPVPTPPIWTGSVGPKSLAATGRVADGWIPGHAADRLSHRYRESRPIIEAAAASAGRDPKEVRTVFNLPGQITGKPLVKTRDAANRWIGGSTEQWIEELTAAVTDHQASGFMLFSPRGGTPDAASLEIWSREIAPAVREATLTIPSSAS